MNELQVFIKSIMLRTSVDHIHVPVALMMCIIPTNMLASASEFPISVHCTIVGACMFGTQQLQAKSWA